MEIGEQGRCDHPACGSPCRVRNRYHQITNIPVRPLLPPIAGALQMNEAVLRKKREDFEAREAASEVRRKEMDEVRKRDDERKRIEDIRHAKERADKYAAAVETEEMRKSRIKDHAEEKDRVLAELYARRKKENDIKKCEQEFEMKLRLDKVRSCLVMVPARTPHQALLSVHNL